MVANSLTKSNQKKNTGLMAYLTQDAVKEQIKKVVGVKDYQRFISAIISATQTNPSLKECSNSSILSSALLGECLKLSPSPQLGHYHLVPFNTKNGREAQLQLGYKGYIQLAIRSGMYKKLNVISIKDGELVHFDPLTEEIEVNLIEDEEERENAETIGYYAMFEYTNGFRKAIYWSKQKMEKHALKYSAGYRAKKGYTFWEKDFDGMAYKTMLRQLISKWGIMSIEMQKAVSNDMAVIADDGTPQYVDNYVDNVEEPQEQPQEVVADVEVEEVKTNEAENVLFSK